MDISAKYTGMMPVMLPIAGELMFEKIPPYYPGYYPDNIPFGHWYHTPAASACKFRSADIGDNGCTWRAEHAAYITYGDELLAAGYNITDTPDGQFPDDEMVRHNANVFHILSATRRCCGC